MTYDPKNPHYDPYTAPPVFDSGHPVTGPGYPDGGYPDSQQPGYPGQQPYAQPQGPAYGPGGYTTPAMPIYRQPENGLGIAALVLGILSLVACGLFAAIPALICGHMGVKKADRGEADNRSMAQAGVIMGYISLGLSVLVIIFYVVMILIALNSAPSGSEYSY